MLTMSHFMLEHDPIPICPTRTMKLNMLEPVNWGVVCNNRSSNWVKFPIRNVLNSHVKHSDYIKLQISSDYKLAQDGDAFN